MADTMADIRICMPSATPVTADDSCKTSNPTSGYVSPVQETDQEAGIGFSTAHQPSDGPVQETDREAGIRFSTAHQPSDVD